MQVCEHRPAKRPLELEFELLQCFSCKTAAKKVHSLLLTDLGRESDAVPPSPSALEQYNYNHVNPTLPPRSPCVALHSLGLIARIRPVMNIDIQSTSWCGAGWEWQGRKSYLHLPSIQTESRGLMRSLNFPSKGSKSGLFLNERCIRSPAGFSSSVVFRFVTSSGTGISNWVEGRGGEGRGERSTKRTTNT